MMQDETRVEVVQGDEGSVETLAREALLSAEFARTDVVNPVNGTAPYTYVKFHGQRVEFHDGEWATMNERDAGSGKAAAYAQTINDSLFELAKRAVRIGMERAAFAAPPAGEKVGDLWQELLDKDDRTSPEEYPDHALITFDEFSDYIGRACHSHPLPADREAIARIMYERFVEENGGFFNEKNGCGFGTWDELSDKSIWLSAAGFVLALWPTPSAGRDGSGSTVPIAMIIPSLEGARATLQHFAETLADSEPRKLPLAAAFAASEASRLAAAIMLLSPPSTEKGEK